MRRLRRIAIAVALVLGLARTSAAADPFEINVILPLTGTSTFVGQGILQGLQAVEQFVNRSGGIAGRPVKFVVHDDQSIPQITVELTNQIMAQHVSVIVGTASSGSCRAMLPLAKDGPVMYCLSPAVYPEAGSFGFSSSIANADLHTVGIRYFRERGWTRIATITSTDATGQDADRAVAAALALPENRAVRLVDVEHFGLADISVNAQLAHIKAADAQVLIVGTTGTPAGTVFRGMTELGLTIPVGINNGNATYAEMKQFAAILPKELYFFAAPVLAPNEITDPATKAALKNYFATLSGMGIRADVIQTAGWDPGLIVVNAFKALGTNATAAQLRDAIANLKGWVGVNGPYDFRTYPQRGLGAGEVVIARWDAAKGTWIGASRPGGIPLR